MSSISKRSFVMWAAALDFGSKLLGARSDRKARRRQEQREDTFIQRRVADAKAAGIGPLAALGAAYGGTPGVSTGSVAGDAFEVASQAMQKRSKDKLARQTHDASLRESAARTERDKAMADKLRSDVAIATQRANVKQDGSATMKAFLDRTPGVYKDKKGYYTKSPSGKMYFDPTMTPAETFEQLKGSIRSEYEGVKGGTYDTLNELIDKWSNFFYRPPGKR